MKRTTTNAGRKAEAALRDFALGYPETREDFPLGHIAIKVRGKVFLFLGGSETGTSSLSVKLTASHTSALDQPYASPPPYGLGKHGWVSARFEAGETPPLDLLRAWIDESYRAVAPKRLVARRLEAAPEAAPAAKQVDASPRYSRRKSAVSRSTGSKKTSRKKPSQAEAKLPGKKSSR